MKKLVLVILITISIVIPAFSAGQGDDQAMDEKGVTISVMAAQTQVKLIEEETIAKQYEEMSGNKVIFNIIPADQFDNLLNTKLNSGLGGDIFLAQSGALNLGPRYNPEKNIVDLSGESWVKTVEPSVLEATSYNGKVYGLQIWNVFQVWSVVYNKAIFAELGLEVPSTYNEFVAVCEKISAAGITPLYSPVSDGWHHVLSFAELGARLNEIDSTYYTKLNDNSITLSEIPEAKTLLEQIYNVTTKYSGKNFMADEFATATIELGDGNYAMMINRVSTAQQIESEYPEGKYGADDFGAFVIPYLDNQIVNLNPQGPSRFIFKTSDNIEASKDYLAYLATQEVLQQFIDNEPTFTALPFTGLKDNLTPQQQNLFKTYPETGTVLQAAVKYIDPQWMDIGSEMAAMFTGQSSAEEVLNNIDKYRSRQAEAVNDPNWK